MKRVFLFIICFFVTFSISSKEINQQFLTLKYQAVAIGQLSLAYRLVALSTSLAIAKAVDSDYIIALLDNVDSTIINCKNIVAVKNENPDKLTIKILSGISSLLSCSKNVKTYSASQTFENLNKVKECIDSSNKMIDSLSEDYNKITTIKK